MNFGIHNFTKTDGFHGAHLSAEKERLHWESTSNI